MQDATVTDDQIRELSDLLDQWDPIGVYQDGDDAPPPGEYERLVGPVLAKLRKGDSPADIAAYLTRHVRANMGLPGRPDGDLAAAERLYAWFHDTEGP